MKFAICHELFEDWDWQRQCQFIADTGYTGIELAPFTLAERITDVPVQQRSTMRKQAEELGLQIIGMHWLLAKTDGLHISTAESAVREATAAYLVDLGNACADFGGSVMVFGSPAQRNLEPGLSRDQAFSNAASVFKTALPQLADRGVNICMEPLTTNETDFINTCAEAMTLIEMVDEPNFRLHQDVKAMLGAETEPLPSLITTYAPHVGHFHVNDTNLLGPGMGETNFEPIFEALLKSKYNGWVSVEVFDYSPGCETIARDSMRYMQETLARIGR